MWKSIIVIVNLILLVSSCMHNKIRYIQDKNEMFGEIKEYPNHAPDYLIQKKDILYIRITSSNKEINQLFVAGGAQLSSMSTGQGNPFFLTGTIVNDTGCINLPIIGSILVEGKTIEEIRELTATKVNEHINNSDVTVSLVSFNLTFLGEFSSQGKKIVMQDNINVLDAVALAGGITDYGNKRNVLIVRQTKDGSKTMRVDLTKRDLLESDKYYLLPNDIIIAEPLKNKSFQLGARDYILVLSTATSTITMVLLVFNLLK